MATSVDAKLLRTTKFPAEFNQKVDMQKVNLQVMKKWIAGKISNILGSEDDVVIELCFNLIDGPRFPDIKSMQIQLTGFLDKDTAPFCKDLWKLCLSAQTSPQGVPKELLEAKKLELIQEKIQAEKAAEQARVRRELQERRERELTEGRDRDRRERPQGGRGDTWRGRRGGDRGSDDRTRDLGRGGRDRSFSPRRDRASFRGDRNSPRGDSFRRGRDSFRGDREAFGSQRESFRGDRMSFRGDRIAFRGDRDRDRYVPADRRAQGPGKRGRSVSRSASPDSRASVSRSRSRSRSRSLRGGRRPSRRSPTPLRRRGSRRLSPAPPPPPPPPPRRDSRKRSRSRSRRDNRSRRPQYRRSTLSQERTSESDGDRRRSRIPKRRRYYDSPSRSRIPRHRNHRANGSHSPSLSRSRSPRRHKHRGSRSRSSSHARSRSRPRRLPVKELISRSPSPARHGRLRRAATRSMSRRPSRRGSQSRSRAEPPSKRRHSPESPRTRGKSADISEDDDRRHRSAEMDPAAKTAEERQKTPQQLANELREKLLKEKIKKMRNSSTIGTIDGSG